MCNWFSEYHSGYEECLYWLCRRFFHIYHTPYTSYRLACVWNLSLCYVCICACIHTGKNWFMKVFKEFKWMFKNLYGFLRVFWIDAGLLKKNKFFLKYHIWFRGFSKNQKWLFCRFERFTCNHYVLEYLYAYSTENVIRPDRVVVEVRIKNQEVCGSNPSLN